MLTTKNYNFKKPELTDSPPDITVFNKNFDDIDEKLFEALQTLKDFFTNGGEIGGNIILSTGSKVDVSQGNLRGEKGNVTLEANPDNVFLFKTKRSSDNREVTLTIVNNESEACVRPNGATGTGKVDLGNPTVSFKDIFLSGVSKTTNGYDKLPNGFIEQWGEIDLSGTQAQSNNAYPTFPTAFPNACLHIDGNASPRDANTNAVPCNFYIEKNNAGSFHYRISGATSSVNTKIQWRAIGY